MKLTLNTTLAEILAANLDELEVAPNDIRLNQSIDKVKDLVDLLNREEDILLHYKEEDEDILTYLESHPDKLRDAAHTWQDGERGSSAYYETYWEGLEDAMNQVLCEKKAE